MSAVPSSLRELLATGPLATVATIDPDGTPYAVVQGHVDRITEGGALELMDSLSEFYIGPGQTYPMREVPDGVVVHVAIDRVYGQGPWAQG